MEDQRRLLIQVILVSWRRESWKPLEAEEEDEEGRSMAPTRLPRCVRRAKLLLRLATSPRVPSSGLDSAPPRLHHSTCAVLLCSSCSKQPPQMFILLQISIPTWPHSVCYFLPRQVGAAGNTRQRRFRSRRQGCISLLQAWQARLCRLISRTRRCNCFLRVVVSFINIGIDLYLDSIH